MHNSGLRWMVMPALALGMLGCQLFTGLSAVELPTVTPFSGGQAIAPSAPPVEARPTETQPGPDSPTQEASPGQPGPTLKPENLIPLEGEPCPQETCIVNGSFRLERPIIPPGRDSIVTASRYGTYQRGSQRALTGVYFLNSTGTPVLAAADGKVVFAGDDQEKPLGPFKDLYGEVVIVRHDLATLEKPIFTVYAHLSEIEVENGDLVQAGQEIGKVGSSGSATGSTLLFEVRLGKNHFQNTRNPELWLKPLVDDDGKRLGAIAGRFIRKNGRPVEVKNIVLEQLAGPGMPAIDQIYLETYTGKRQSGQPPWIENFAAGDLPPGEYQISFMGDGVETRLVTVEPGKLTLVTIVLP